MNTIHVLQSRNNMAMKAITVKQPWAWAIIHARKNIENRSWATRHRGPIMIHAGSDRREYDRINPDAFESCFGVALPPKSQLTFGAIIGQATVIECYTWDDLPDEHDSPWAFGPWCWVLSEARSIAPIPMPGQLGLWNFHTS